MPAATGDIRPLRDARVAAAVAVAALIALALTSLHSYTLFHSIVEVVFAVVSVAVLVVAWSLREFLDDDFPVFLGVALCAVALLHVTHMVDFSGMDAITDSADPPTQLWLAARFLAAASFLIAPSILGRRVPIGLVAVAFLAVDALVISAIYWWRVFPRAFTGGELTAFKKVAEYVICVLFALAMVRLWRRREALPQRVWALLLAALAASIVTEIWFTLYQTPQAWPNLAGHLFLVLSALLIYRALVEDGLARPHALAMASLREAEAMHQGFERGLLPALSVRHGSLDVRVQYRPGESRLALGGDFIDAVDYHGRGVAVICGDVSGRGPSAAALGATLRAGWEALVAAAQAPEAIVESLRTVLIRERESPEVFATLSLAWIDGERGEAWLVNIGHPVPLLVTADGVTPLRVPPSPPLGTIAVPPPEPLRVLLPPDWQLFFYTDGLIEGRLAGSRERFGEERLIAALQGLSCEPLDEACLERLLAEVEAVGGGGLNDDVAVVVVAPASIGAAATDHAPAAEAAGQAAVGREAAGEEPGAEDVAAQQPPAGEAVAQQLPAAQETAASCEHTFVPVE